MTYGGFAMSFEAAGQGQWGGVMQDDLTDATLSLIEQEISNGLRAVSNS